METPNPPTREDPTQGRSASERLNPYRLRHTCRHTWRPRGTLPRIIQVLETSTALTMPALLLAALLLGDPIEIEVTPELGDLDAPVQEQVTERIAQLSTSMGHPPSTNAEHILSIAISWNEDSKTDFLVKFEIGSRDALAPSGSFVCPECSATDLLERTATEAETLIEALFVEDAVATSAPPEPTPPPPAPAETPPPRRAPLGRLGWGGVGSLGIGVAGVATGVAFMMLGERRVESRSLEPSRLSPGRLRRSWGRRRRPGDRKRPPHSRSHSGQETSHRAHRARARLLLSVLSLAWGPTGYPPPPRR